MSTARDLELRVGDHVLISTPTQDILRIPKMNGDTLPMAIESGIDMQNARKAELVAELLGEEGPSSWYLFKYLEQQDNQPNKDMKHPSFDGYQLIARAKKFA